MAYKTIYPFTNETLKEYANHTDAELEQAIASGHALYKKWRRENNLEERKAQLHKVAELLRRDADKYAETITKDRSGRLGLGQRRHLWWRTDERRTAPSI